MENIFTLDVFLISLPIYIACIVVGYMLAIKPKRSKTKALSFAQEIYDGGADEEELKLEYKEDFELYLKLSKMFRKAGEFDKAVRIHQRMLEKENISNELRTNILLELGKDFLASGMFADAEEKFLACLESTEKKSKLEELCNRELSKLYERQSKWEEAVKHRRNLAIEDKGHKSGLALLLCNLAKDELKKENIGNAKELYQEALTHDKDCVLAVKELISISLEENKKQETFALLKDYVNSSIRLVNLLVPAFEVFLEDFEYTDQTIELLEQLIYSKFCAYEIGILYSRQLHKQKDRDKLNKFISMYNENYKNSLQAIYAMASLVIELNIKYTSDDKQSILLEKIANMLKDEYNYQCSSCGYHSKNEFWCCSQCQKWNTVERIYR